LQAPKKILVIDDEAYIRRVIELKLSKRGYEVITASNGREGLELIATKMPDAVITDVMMPEMDGRTLCERTDGLKRERPFLTVIITCRILPEERDWLVHMHDTLFMEKPFSPSRLAQCIDQYFNDPMRRQQASWS